MKKKSLGVRVRWCRSESRARWVEEGSAMPGSRDVLLLLLPTLLAAAVRCPRECRCSSGNHELWTNCSALNLTSVPLDIAHQTVLLDLSWNTLTQIPEFSFESFSNLHELNLTGNRLKNLFPNSFTGLQNLRSLSLQSNMFQEVPAAALRSVPNVETLRLNDNLLSRVDEGAFSSVAGKLRLLWLNENMLRQVPAEGLQELAHVEALNLANNEISRIADYTFQNLSSLMILVLKQNRISEISTKAFEGLTSLKVLEINDNELTQVTTALSTIPTLKELTFAGNSISHLAGDVFRDNKHLALIEMGGNPITSVDHSTFAHLPHLKKLTLSEVRQLREFPDLTGTVLLEHLRLDRCHLRSVDPQICVNSPHLKSLNLKSNRITKVPVLRGCTELKLLDLSYNLIVSVEGALFMHQTKLIDLFLSNNLISYVSRDAWLGLESLYVLALDNNKIGDIDPEAFVPLKELRDLNLASNLFPTLPSKGLQSVRQLKTFNNRNLKEFPPPEHFPRIQTLALSYAYHCCAFLPPAGAHKPTVRTPASLQETIVWLQKEDVDMSVWNANFTDIWPGYENFSSKFEEFASELWKAFGRDYAIPDNIAQYAEEYFEDYKSIYNSDENLLSRYPIKCLPEPGPFMPCEDLFGWWTLRCGVWVVFLLAMLGNGVVVVVLLFGRSKLDVPRFLVCNLAMADFFMGVYLGILAVVDASTLGEYKVYAIPWQLSAGCQIAGFLGVLSSELSVYTLSVITLERNYAITHAMHLNKRLSLKHAGYIMSCGWLFALIMALLPLVGISDYRKFAVCLPFEIDDVWSLAYVVFLILINGVAFLILMGCYLKMYCAIRGSQAWNSNDSRIAKRMALLVFTDFICWAPIAFFSLTAVFGLELISLEEAKVFTIFVLPLNSCANPFLYAIFTKQFKKDCVLICKRIEESRVTRGIGRCRHSSNFSNRHTPANTNSAADRKSGSDQTPNCQCAQNTKANNTNSDSRTRFFRSEGGAARGDEERRRRRRPGWKSWAFFYLLCHEEEEQEPSSNDYTYAIAQIQKSVEHGHKRASSISSENFSSRSDSWRQGNVSMRLLERGGGGGAGGGGNRRNSWSVTRKPSQDSNLSCSRQDSSTSTFRMSRSSVSSDNSNPPAGGRTFSSLRERPSNPTNGEAACAMAPQRPFGSVREKTSASVEVTASGQVRCFPRGMMSMMSKDKPKLCRQTAVDDPTGSRIHRVEGRPFQRSPPFGQAREAVCPSCSSRKDTSPPLTFKNKELEDKFNCFYNQLAETSHEESSEVSKEEQGVLSTESKGEGTNESSLQDSDGGRPDIEIIDPQPPHASEEDLCAEATGGDGSQTSSQDPQRLHVSADNIREHKSHSMTSIDNEAERRLSSSRKTASDNSIKKLSLKSLPAMLRSFSSQRFVGGHNLKVRSHVQLRPLSDERLPSSRSEAIIHHGSCGDWRVTLRDKRGVQSLVEAADDVFCCEQKRSRFGNTTEDVPLIDQDVEEIRDHT